MQRVGYVVLYVILIIIAIVQIFPLFWLFLFSLKDNQQIFAKSPFSLPDHPHWENYLKAWQGNIGIYFFSCV